MNGEKVEGLKVGTNAIKTRGNENGLSCNILQGAERENVDFRDTREEVVAVGKVTYSEGLNGRFV